MKRRLRAAKEQLEEGSLNDAMTTAFGVIDDCEELLGEAWEFIRVCRDLSQQEFERKAGVTWTGTQQVWKQ